MSVATNWSDFVTIYDIKKYKALTFFFLCVQAVFLAGHSAVRGFVARKLCCCFCAKNDGKKTQRETPTTLVTNKNGDLPVQQLGATQMMTQYA